MSQNKEISYKDLLLTCNFDYWLFLCFEFFASMTAGVILISKLREKLTNKSLAFILFLMALNFSDFSVSTWQYFWETLFEKPG